MLVAILLVLAAAVVAQRPRPCESPAQFEARGISSDFKERFREYSRISYDETRRRIRRVEFYEEGSERESYDVLVLYTENKEYRLNIRTRQCNVTTPSRPWHPAGIPSNASFEGFESIGPVNIPTEHVTVLNFRGRTEEGHDFFGTVSSPDCVPVARVFTSAKKLASSTKASLT